MHYSGGYTEADLKPWAAYIMEFLKSDISKYEAAFKKYSSKKLMKTSVFVQDYMTKYSGIPAFHALPKASTTVTTTKS